MTTPTPLRQVALFSAPVPELVDGPRLVARVPTTFAPAQLPPRAVSPGQAVNWQLVVMLRQKVSEEYASRLSHAEEVGGRLDEADRRLLGRSVINAIVHEHAERLTTRGEALWSLDIEQAYAQAVESATFGYGRLQPLFEIPDAENVEIHGFDSVVVQRGDGTRYAHEPVAESDEELVQAIRFLGESATPPRPFDDAHPTMTLALGDRFRLHAIGFGLAYRPSITIRQHTLTDVTLRDLVASGMLPERLAVFLHAAVLARKSIVISGDQGAGKTTLLRALIASIPAGERFGTVETDYELLTHLQPNRRNIVALQARIGLGERLDGRALGEFSVAELIPEALRQNLSRIIVGEVRGAEAAAMFAAMTSGAGGMSTTHSHSASSAMDRLASRAAEGGAISLAEAYRQIAHNISLLIHVKLIDDTWRGGRRRRLVSEVRYVTGAIENDRPITHLTYLADTDGRDHAGFRPDPQLWQELLPYLNSWNRSDSGNRP